LVFEDTYARGAPLVFEYGIRPPGVCEGLEEAIGTMRAGGRRLVAVPPEVGFGNKVRSIHWSPYDRVGAVNAVS
jgi:FKBP-type peptidyl-prolyl cis-trans isomerase